MAKKRSSARGARGAKGKKGKKKSSSRRYLVSYNKGSELVRTGVWTQEELERNIEKGVVGPPRSLARFYHEDPRVHAVIQGLLKQVEEAADSALMRHFGVVPSLRISRVEPDKSVKVPPLDDEPEEELAASVAGEDDEEDDLDDFEDLDDLDDFDEEDEDDDFND